MVQVEGRVEVHYQISFKHLSCMYRSSVVTIGEVMFLIKLLTAPKFISK